MESLAFAAAIVVAVVAGSGVATVALIVLGMTSSAAAVGLASVATGAWWLCVTSPTVPLLSMFNIAVGLFAILRCIYVNK